MEIVLANTIVGGNFVVKITTKNFSSDELVLIAKFGEPRLETGGEFLGGSEIFTLPTAPKLLKTDFTPLTTVFGNPDEARVYGQTLVARLWETLHILRNRGDDFTSTQTFTDQVVIPAARINLLTDSFGNPTQ